LSFCIVKTKLQRIDKHENREAENGNQSRQISFKPKIMATQTTTPNPALVAAAQQNLNAEIAKIKAAPADSTVALANPQVLASTSATSSTWAGAGLLDVAGLGYYTTSCDLIIAGDGIGAVDFSASGFSWAAVAVECEVAGLFVVDPATVGGSCNFTVVTGAVGEGAVVLTLYSSGGTLYGSFAGNADGIGAGVVSGSGTLTVAHT